VDKSIDQIYREASQEINAAPDRQAVQDISVHYLGRKGVITQFLRNISKLPAEQRPVAGKQANEVKNLLDAACKEAIQKLETAAKTDKKGIDVSLPGRPAPGGSLHPITQINQRICDIFTEMGFEIAEGPEVELDYYNFEALNFPKDHPARDMQDTFFISDDIVLRTHTSPLQIRTMEKQQPPVRIIMPGKVYRCDSDLTHTPMFHQVEGLLVDENVVDILCVMCRGKGCRVCSQTGWLEILGSGMVHPALYENVGYEADRYTGFAFGMGVDRIAMLKYGIDDIRKFFENDMRFLAQF
jgi:phenylalanyl-tRNA synthetase alpha chain